MLTELLVRFGADLSGLRSAPADTASIAAQAAQRMAAAAGKVPVPGVGFDQAAGRFRAASGRFISATDAMRGGVTSFNSSLSQTISLQGLLAATAISGAIASVAQQAIQAALSIDSYSRALTAVSAEGDTAENQLLRLRDVARLPGLGFEEAVAGSTRLQAVGFSAQFAERTLMAFGNATAAAGGGKNELDRIILQLGQMASAGRVLQQDLRPIIQQSPLVGRALREAFGTISPEEINNLGLTTEEFLTRLVSQLEEIPRVTGGPKNAIENLQDSFFLAGATVGNAFLPQIERMANVIGPAVERVADLFAALPESVKGGVAIFVALTAAAGPIALALSAISGPALLVVAAIALISAAASYVIEKWDSISHTLQGPLAFAMEFGRTLFADLGDIVVMVMEVIGAAVDYTVQLISVIWKTYGQTIMAVVTNVWGVVKDVIVTALNIIKNALTFWSAVFRGDWAGAWEAIKRIVMAPLAFVVRTVGRALDIVLANVQDFANFFGIGINNALQTARDNLSGFVQGLEVDVPVTVRPQVEEPTGDITAPDVPNNFGSATQGGSDRLTEAEKRAKRIRDIIRDLPIALARATTEAAVFRDTENLAAEKADLIRRAIGRLLDEGLTPSSAQVATMIRQFSVLSAQAQAFQKDSDAFETMKRNSEAAQEVRQALADAGREADLFNTALELPGRQIDILARALLDTERQFGANSYAAKVLAVQLFNARQEADYLAGVDASLARGEGLSAAQERIDRMFMATGQYADYASGRAAALAANLEVLQDAGATIYEIRDAWQAFERAQRIEQITNLAKQALTDLRQSAIDFGVATLTAMAGAALGLEGVKDALMQAAGQLIAGVFETLGNLLIQVGLTALGVGAGIQAIVTALTTLNPFVAIAAGVALLALGALVKSSLSNIGKGGASSFGGGGGARTQAGGTYGGSGRSAAAPGEDGQRATLEELRGLREDVRALRDRPVNFTGDPREFRRAQGAAAEYARRSEVATG